MADNSMKFSVDHAESGTFVAGGLRPYFEYRDLGIKDATGGKVVAHVIRAARPFDGSGTGTHRHSLDFQLVYVLKGWARFHYDGEGEVTVRAGSCVHQPPGIRHNLVEYSDDFEVLEICSPADFGTEDLDAKEKATAV